MLKLGNVFGIKVYLHWTLGILAAILLPPMYEFVSLIFDPVPAGAIAALMAIGFIGSVLFHELAHCLMARRFGVNTKRITLFLFGGAAQLCDGWTKPKSEFWIALAGPVSSMALCVVGILVAALLGGPWVSVIGTFAMTNFVLAVFNLIPAFPMDGGRIFRSAIWYFTNDFRKATLAACWLGRVFAAFMIVCGVLMVFGTTIPILGGGWFNGIWIATISFMLLKMVDNELERVGIK